MLRRATLSLLALLAAAGAARAEDIAFFEGVWLGVGYSCYDIDGKLVPSEEQVEISADADTLSATKIDPSPCPGLGPDARRAGVSEGEVSWRATLPAPNVEYLTPYDAESHLSGPGGERAWAPGEIEMVGPDEIIWRTPSATGVQPIVFHRLHVSSPTS